MNKDIKIKESKGDKSHHDEKYINTRPEEQNISSKKEAEEST